MNEKDRRWNLDVLFKSFDDPAFAAGLDAYREYVRNINEWAEKNLAGTKNVKEKLEEYIGKVNELDAHSAMEMYASLSLEADTRNEAAEKACDAVRTIDAEMVKSAVIFRKFISGVDDIDAVIDSSALLRQYAFALKEAHNQSRHMLSEAEEILYAKLQQVGSDAFSLMVNQLTATLTVDMERDGAIEKIPLSAARNLANDPDPAVRKAAYEAELKAYDQVDKPIAAGLNAIKGDAILQARLRGFDTVLDMTLFNGRMERATLEAMLEAIREKIPVLRRYYRKKAAGLGHDGGLPFYDLVAPAGEVAMTFTYDEACDFVVKVFTGYSKKMGDFARHCFDNDWIDPFPRPGKSGGAFCAGVWNIRESRILSNFDGSYNSVETLAHELGHAYHNLCLKDVGFMNRLFTSCLAETASNYCEIIVEDAALKSAADTGMCDGEAKKRRMAILDNSLRSAVMVVIDIYSRFLFEDEFIRRRQNGPLSVREINELMLWAQRESYGDGLDPEYLHKYMWACKVHYYSANANYYNFPYTYGLLFARGIYAKYLNEGDAFLDKYDSLLAETGRHSLEGVGKIAGLDVTNKEFWLGSLGMIEKMVDEFCE